MFPSSLDILLSSGEERDRERRGGGSCVVSEKVTCALLL